MSPHLPATPDTNALCTELSWDRNPWKQVWNVCTRTPCFCMNHLHDVQTLSLFALKAIWKMPSIQVHHKDRWAVTRGRSLPEGHHPCTWALPSPSFPGTHWAHLGNHMCKLRPPRPPPFICFILQRFVSALSGKSLPEGGSACDLDLPSLTFRTAAF